VSSSLLLDTLLFKLLTHVVDGFGKRFEAPIIKPLFQTVMMTHILRKNIFEYRFPQTHTGFDGLSFDSKHAGGLSSKSIKDLRGRGTGYR
jgi:hypothetical protein